MHVAGKICVLCRQPIGGNRDGAFCDFCESPVHMRCAAAGPAAGTEEPCGRCGVSLTARLAELREAERAAAFEDRGMGRLDLYGGLFLVAAGLTATCGSLAITGGNMVLVTTGLLVAGLGLVARGVRRMKARGPDE